LWRECSGKIRNTEDDLRCVCVNGGGVEMGGGEALNSPWGDCANKP